MIYIYNSNIKFQKQIDYAFSNIFYILGLEYTFLNYNLDKLIKNNDLLIIYDEKEYIPNITNKYKNVILIKPSNKLFGNDYLKIKSMPNKIKKYKDIISIYSEDKELYINKEFSKDFKIIKTNIDIISDIFFMLTRYEEIINKNAYEKERFNRFPAIESFAYKNNFLNRPVVNEHIDLLWNFINMFNLGYIKKKWWGNKDFAACLTHDVDYILKYNNFISVIKHNAKLLLKNKKFLITINNIFNYFKGYKNDPFYTFDYIINLEKSYKFKSSFYFLSGGTSEFDNSYDINDIKVFKLIKQIENEGFEVGYHCSFNSYNDFNLLNVEKRKLDLITTKKPYGCRQHFLRFKVPYTWRYQEKLGLLYDASLSFADAEGFRCGTCFPFKPYDILEDRIIDIWEIPLIVMEGSLQNKAYRAYSSDKGLDVTKKLIDTVKKYKGVFTLLYHNSSFDYSEILWDGWKETFEETMKYLYENNCLGTSGEEIIKIITK